MKQHIKLEQLNELSDKGKEKLRDWWKPQEGDWYSDANQDLRFKQPTYGKFEYENLAYEDYDNYIPESKINCLPLLSIGQMIEFLDDDNSGTSLLIEHWSPDYETDPYEWTVKHKSKEYGNNTYELCDALWEACVELLNDEI